MPLQLRRLSHALGAEVAGVDLTRLHERQFAELNSAFLDHGILLFRGQALTTEQHIALSRGFGELDTHDNAPQDRHPDHTEVLLITNAPKPTGAPSDTRYTGRVWHSDHSFTLVPALGSLLRAVEIPDVGGDTLFTNMYLAYDALSEGMKKLIAGLHGIHATARKIDDPARAADMKRRNPPVAQPLVRVHPETGRKALYVGEKVKRIVGLTAEESQPLLSYLCGHATRHEFVYRHQWRKHDLVMWDNRCTMHLALGDFDETQLRHMERTTVLGTPSGYVYDGPLH
jgi:taurine dioxygenase